MSEPADHTATLAPRDAPTVASESAPVRRPAPTQGERGEGGEAAVPGALPIDDPDRYEQIGEHARGGLGRVVRAVDRRLGRTVAVKELLRHDDGHEARFVREALITARLEHPGIVPVHEAGRWPNGDPYYVMKLVEGRTLKELLAQTKTLRERIALLPHVIAIADAVGYAHSEGVIHRDLKPSNVIVGEFGETIVIDWGLARDCKQDVPEPALVRAEGSGSTETISGKVIGTPAYMAPEQARGEIVDERADVYAIGALLYELLAGHAPHADATPQAVLDRVIAGPPAPLCQVAPNVPAELADLVGKAMQRHPGDRYANGTALAEDLRRFQTGQLVTAHAYTPWQILRKKLAQHRGVVVVALASAIALAAIGVESFRKVVSERDLASAERSRAEEAGQTAKARARELLLVQAETSLRKDPTAALAWLKQYETGAQDLPQVVDVVDEALALGVARHVFRPGDWVMHSRFTPDGKSVITAVRDASVRRYDVATGQMSLIGRGPSAAEMIAISPDGAVAVTGGTLGEVIAWPLKGGASRTLVERGRMIRELVFAPDGKRLLVDRESGADEIVDMADGKVTRLGIDTVILMAVAAHDWTHAAALVEPNQIAVVAGDTTRKLAETERKVYGLWLSPDGQLVLAHDGSTVWVVPYAGGALKKLAAYNGKVTNLAWSPDGKKVVLLGTSPVVNVVDLATASVRELRGHTDQLYTAEFTRDGTHLLTASDDGTARIWDLSDGGSRVLRGHDDDVYSAYFSPDEKMVVTSSLDASLRVWPLDRDGTRELSEGQPIDWLSIEGDDALVQTRTSLARWNLETGARDQLFEWGAIPGSLGIGLPSPDGEALVVPIPEPSWTLEIRRRSGPPVVLRGHKGLVNHAEWTQDSKYLVTSSVDGTLRKWDTQTGEAQLIVEGDVPVRNFAVARDGRIAAQVGDRLMLIHPDGKTQTLGSGSAWCLQLAQFEKVRDRLIVQRCDHTVLVYDGDHMFELATDGYEVTRFAISPDGELIAGGMNDRSVRVWTAAGKLRETLRGHSDLVMDVAFSPDGKQLASSSYDRTVRVWELGSSRHRVLRGHTGPVTRVSWRGAGQLVSVSGDGTLRLWHAPDLALPTQAEMSARLETATTASIDRQNRATTAVN